MAKVYRKAKKTYVKKARVLKRVASVPRPYFPYFPDTMKLAIPFVQSANYQVAQAAYAQFAIQPMTPFQIQGQGPGMLADIMRFYETGHVISATVKTTFMSREVGNAEALNIVAAITNSRDLNRAPAFGTFTALQSALSSQQKFLSPATGGHDVVSFSHTFQVQSPYSSSMDSAITSLYDPIGAFAIFAPLQVAVADSPCVLYMYTPVQDAQCNFQVTRKIIFNILFSRPHYPRLPIVAEQPPQQEDEFHMETESFRSSQTPINRQLTQGFKKMSLNNYNLRN